MKKFRILYLSMAFLAVMPAFSCKKKGGNDVTSKYLSGSLKFNMPKYVAAGEKYTLTPSGVTHPEGGSLGYYWIVSAYSLRDTVKKVEDPATVIPPFTLDIRDQLGTFTVTCGAFAPGYYASTGSQTFTVVDPSLGGTLTGTGVSASDDSIIDSRDQKVYYYKSIDGTDWFRNNLAYSGSGIPYEDCPVMSDVFGRYYTWEEAAGACPEGWRLPTLGEWKNLASSISPSTEFNALDKFPGVSGAMMVDARFNNVKMWEFWPDVTITNSTGLAMIPSGFATIGASHEFNVYGTYAAFWTADSQDSSMAWYRYINVNAPDVFIGVADKTSFAASVRCVRDSQ